MATAPEPKENEVNLARDKEAWQSQTYDNKRAERAVDGNYNTNWDYEGVSSTDNYNHPWWAVDLGGIYKLDYVNVLSRDDASSKYIKL